MSQGQEVVTKSQIWKALALALLAVVLWSGNFIVARGLHLVVPPVTLAFFRWSVATIILLPIAYRSLQKDRAAIGQHFWYLILVGITGVTLFNTLIYVAAHSTTAINLALIGTTAAPIFVLLIAAILLKHTVHWNQWLGGFLCLTGILILLSNGSIQQLKAFRFASGDIWVVVAALSFAIYTILVKRKPANISHISFLFAIFFLGTFMLLPPWLIEISKTALPAFSWKLLWIFLYLGIGASVISFLCWNYTIRTIGPARTALFGNLIPVLSAIEAAIILNEPFSTVTLVSMLIIGIGILLGNFKIVLGK